MSSLVMKAFIYLKAKQGSTVDGGKPIRPPVHDAMRIEREGGAPVSSLVMKAFMYLGLCLSGGGEIRRRGGTGDQESVSTLITM